MDQWRIYKGGGGSIYVKNNIQNNSFNFKNRVNTYFKHKFHTFKLFIFYDFPPPQKKPIMLKIYYQCRYKFAKYVYN